MTTEEERRAWAGKLLRDTIIEAAMSFSDAAAAMKVARPTLYKIMHGGVVLPRYYTIAEIAVGLPVGLLRAIIDGDVARIRSLGLDATMMSRVMGFLDGNGGGRGRARSGKA